MLFLFLFPGCAPEPASITFDGGNERVVVHARDGVPVKRAVVRDADGKALDPQPRVTWDVDRTDVVALADGKLVPVDDGIARVRARVAHISASYTFVVELDDGPAKAGSVSFSGCSVTNYGNGVLTFSCDDGEFPRGLAAYLAEHGTPTVTAMSPLRDNSYLVVTRSL